MPEMSLDYPVRLILPGPGISGAEGDPLEWGFALLLFVCHTAGGLAALDIWCERRPYILWHSQKYFCIKLWFIKRAHTHPAILFLASMFPVIIIDMILKRTKKSESNSDRRPHASIAFTCFQPILWNVYTHVLIMGNLRSSSFLNFF